MPPKKKVEEHRTATDIEVENAKNALDQGEQEVENCKQAIVDLAAHATKLKQLEAALAPLEAEQKAIAERFAKLLDGAGTSKKARGLLSPHLAGQLADDTRPTSGSQSAATNARAAAQQHESSATEDRDAYRQLAAATRECVSGLLLPLFSLPRTPNEEHNAAVLAARIAEATGTAPEGQPPAGAVPSPGKNTPRKKATTPAAVPKSQQPYRAEPALLPLPGMDPQVHADVLKLREQRLVVEHDAAALTAQIKFSRDTIQRIKDDGRGTKAALKKAERDLLTLTKAFNALRLRKEEEEIIRRRNDEAAAKKKDEKEPKKASK